MRKINIDISKLRKLVAQAYSMVHLCSLLGVRSQTKMKRLIKENKIDTSHFPQSARSRKRPLCDYLSNKYSINCDSLKKRLIKEKLKEAKCERCHRTTWEDKPIPIEMHHINGDHLDNDLSNLQILCRNCHGLCPNHKGAGGRRTRSRYITKNEYIEAILVCRTPIEVCRKLGIAPKGRNYDTIYGIIAKEGVSLGSELATEIAIPPNLTGLHLKSPPRKQPIKSEGLTDNQKRYYFSRRKIKNRPTFEEMKKMVWGMSLEKLGEQYNVSGATIKKWLKSYDSSFLFPPRGYWTRRSKGYSHKESLTSQKKKRNPIHSLSKDQTKRAFLMLKNKRSFYSIGLELGFNHETVRTAMARYGLIPDGYRLGKTRHGAPTLTKN